LVGRIAPTSILVANLDKKTAAMQVIRDVTHSQNGDQYAHVIGRGYWQHSLPRQAHTPASLITGYTHAAWVSANPLDSSFNSGRAAAGPPKMDRVGVARLSAPADGSIRADSARRHNLRGRPQGATWAGIDLNYRFK
jgi:hypothetical protein